MQYLATPLNLSRLIFQVIEVIRHPKDKAESKYNPDAGISKEDEERYQKLVTENDDLQKLISQVRMSFLQWFGPLFVPGLYDNFN